MDIEKVQKYEGMIPDYYLPQTIARNEEEAAQLMIQHLRKMFQTMSDSEIINEMGIVVWESNESF